MRGTHYIAGCYVSRSGTGYFAIVTAPNGDRKLCKVVKNGKKWQIVTKEDLKGNGTRWCDVMINRPLKHTKEYATRYDALDAFYLICQNTDYEETNNQ